MGVLVCAPVSSIDAIDTAVAELVLSATLWVLLAAFVLSAAWWLIRCVRRETGTWL